MHSQVKLKVDIEEKNYSSRRHRPFTQRPHRAKQNRYRTLYVIAPVKREVSGHIGTEAKYLKALGQCTTSVRADKLIDLKCSGKLIDGKGNSPSYLAVEMSVPINTNIDFLKKEFETRWHRCQWAYMITYFECYQSQYARRMFNGK